VFLVMGFLLTSVTLFVNALILLVAGLKLARDKQSTPRQVFAVVAVALDVSLMIGVAPGLGESRRLAALQAKYPLVALSDRLEYEKHYQPTYRLVANSPSDHVYLHLLEDDDRIERSSYRNSLFERIHHEEREQFVRAIGFG